MQQLRYTLMADGSSDRALLPILTWLLRQSCGQIPIQPEFADLRRLKRFNWRSSAHRVAEMISDFSVLYRLVAFQRLSAAIEQVATAEEWR